MKRALTAAVVALLALATPVAAREPSGSFTLDSAFVEGDLLTVTVETTGTNRNYEVTVGIKCQFADGTQVPIVNPINGALYIYELTSVRGPWLAPQSLTLWTTGQGYTCRAQLYAVLWRKGTPIQAWLLDAQSFTVEA